MKYIFGNRFRLIKNYLFRQPQKPLSFFFPPSFIRAPFSLFIPDSESRVIPDIVYMCIKYKPFLIYPMSVSYFSFVAGYQTPVFHIHIIFFLCSG